MKIVSLLSLSTIVNSLGCAYDSYTSLQYISAKSLSNIASSILSNKKDDNWLAVGHVNITLGVVGNSNFWFQFLGLPSEAEFQFRFRFWIFRSEFFLEFRCWKVITSEFWLQNSEFHFFLLRNSFYLILYQKTIAISFPAKITSTLSTCKVSRYDFGGQSNHAAELTSTQNK